MDAPSHSARAPRWRCCPPPSSAAGPWCWTYPNLPGSVITADYLERDHPLGGFRAVHNGWERKWGTGAYYDISCRTRRRPNIWFPAASRAWTALAWTPCGISSSGHKTLLDGGLVILESLCLKVVGRTDLIFRTALKLRTPTARRCAPSRNSVPEEKEMEAL